MHLQPFMLVSFTVDVPNWLFSSNTLVGLVVGLVIGLLIGRVSR